MAQHYSQENSPASQLTFDTNWCCASPTLREFDTLPSIVTAPCAMTVSKIDRACFNDLLSDERCSVAFGPPCSQALMQGIHEAIQDKDRGFYTMIDVTLANVRNKLTEWFASKPLGDLPASLEHELKADIERDAIGFINAIQDSPVTLRLVLDVSSGFQDLHDVLSIESPTKCRRRIEAISRELEYDKAFFFHTDAYVVNQIKSYSGATTLGIDPDTIETNPSFGQWWSLFSGAGSLRHLANDAIARRDAGALEEAIRLTMAKAWRYQTELPGVIKPGSSPYRFLLGAPHLYFGRPDVLEPFCRSVQKSTLHAKPLIWASEPGAKRFLTLLDSSRHFCFSGR